MIDRGHEFHIFAALIKSVVEMLVRAGFVVVVPAMLLRNVCLSYKFGSIRGMLLLGRW